MSRQTLALVYDKTANDGYGGRRFPLLWRAFTPRSYWAIFADIYQQLKSDPRLPNLEIVTVEKGMARGPMPSLELVSSFPELHKYWLKEEGKTKTPLRFEFTAYYDETYLLMGYPIKPKYREFGPWKGRSDPGEWWYAVHGKDALNKIMVSVACDWYNRTASASMSSRRNNVIFVVSRNGKQQARENREVTWAEMLAFTRAHPEWADESYKKWFPEIWK